MFLRVWQAAALSTERSEAAYLLRVWSRAAIGTAPTLLTGSHSLTPPLPPLAAFHENIAFFCDSGFTVQIESPFMLNNRCVRVNPSTGSKLARAKPRMCNVRGFAWASLSPYPVVPPCFGAGQFDINVCDMITFDTNIYDTSCVLVGVRAHRADRADRADRAHPRAHGAAEYNTGHIMGE
jgi:hypothetical protein